MIDVLLLFLGIAGLWMGTEWVIKGAVRIAEHYQVSQLFIGIAILAVGTDLPELVISTSAAVEKLTTGVDTSGIIVGNAIGSSISQLSMVLGTAGLLGYLTLTKQHLYVDGAMLLGSIVLVGLFAIDGAITRVEGGALILIYLLYYLRLIYMERLGDKIKSKKASGALFKYVMLLILGMFIVVLAAELVVDRALLISDKLGIQQSFVGIILIGLGTSLPELALSLTAVRKKAGGLSVGNLIGSNIFDTVIPIGVGGVIAELTFDRNLLVFDLPFLFVISAIVLLFFRKKKGLQRKEAIALIVLFGIYAVLKFLGI